MRRKDDDGDDQPNRLPDQLARTFMVRALDDQDAAKIVKRVAFRIVNRRDHRIRAMSNARQTQMEPTQRHRPGSLEAEAPETTYQRRLVGHLPARDGLSPKYNLGLSEVNFSCGPNREASAAVLRARCLKVRVRPQVVDLKVTANL